MKKSILTIMIIGLASYAIAVPAYRGWTTGVTIDGKTVEIRQVGDENGHYWENRAGEMMVLNEAGQWERRSEEEKVRKQEARVERARMRANYIKGEELEVRGAHRAQKVGEANLAPRGLFILVSYDNFSFRATRAAMDSMMNAVHYTDNGATGSARQYFINQSNGQYQPIFDVVGPVKVSKTQRYYGENDYSDNDKHAGDLIVEACKLADEKFDVDFSLYDNNNDGYIDFVYVIYAGKGEADGGKPETIWPHSWDITSAMYYGSCTYDYEDIIFDGKYLSSYACSSELNGQNQREGIGTLVHEFSHVLGLPDFYDTQYSTNYSECYTPGMWDVMDYGSYNGGGHCPPNYSAWEKHFFGWNTPKALTDSVDVMLSTGYEDSYQISKHNELMSWTCTDTLYYIENRQQTGWDSYLPGHGMLVWRVVYDDNEWAYNSANNTARKPRYTLISSDGSKGVHPIYTEYEQDGMGTPWPGKTKKKTAKLGKRTLNDIKEWNEYILFGYEQERKSNGYIVETEHATVDSEWGLVGAGDTLQIVIVPDSGYAVLGEEQIEVLKNDKRQFWGSGYLLEDDVLSVYNVDGELEVSIRAIEHEEEGIESIHSSAEVKKMMVNGEIVIERGGKWYDVMGREHR